MAMPTDLARTKVVGSGAAVQLCRSGGHAKAIMPDWRRHYVIVMCDGPVNCLVALVAAMFKNAHPIILHTMVMIVEMATGTTFMLLFAVMDVFVLTD